MKRRIFISLLMGFLLITFNAQSGIESVSDRNPRTNEQKYGGKNSRKNKKVVNGNKFRKAYFKPKKRR